MVDCIHNHIDSYAFYLFLFLVTLSFGKDCVDVFHQCKNTEFVKNQIHKVENYKDIFSNVLCNNVKKVKNGIVLNVKKTKPTNQTEKPQKIPIKKSKFQNKMIDEAD